MNAKRKKMPQPFWKRYRKGLLWTIGSIIGVFVIVGFLNTFVFLPIKNPTYGVTFTKDRAEEFGLDWQATYRALLDDIGLKRFRLTSYWSAHEPEQGQFDFRDLDWQFDEAAKRGAKISLSIGLRQPRWPECHQPNWALQLTGNSWKQALYTYLEIVVKRYQYHPAFDSWQLENEAVNNWFGVCPEPDRTRLKEEFALVKQLDPNHPIVMSLSDQHGIPLDQPVPDIYGFSVYRIVYNTFGPDFYIYYPTPIWYHRLRAAIITAIHHKPIMIHELQMEPWGPRDTTLLSPEEQDRSMSEAQIHKSFDFARRLNLSPIDLWGGEWWYWRKLQGDERIWNAVKTEVRQ
jgi:hypothetical protein